LGSKPLILRSCRFKKKKDFIWEAGESKKNATTARFHLFSHLDFPKRGSIVPGHVGTLFLPANEKLRGIEHAQLKKEP
jgi:hypothetical protein